MVRSLKLRHHGQYWDRWPFGDLYFSSVLIWVFRNSTLLIRLNSQISLRELYKNPNDLINLFENHWKWQIKIMMKFGLSGFSPFLNSKFTICVWLTTRLNGKNNRLQSHPRTRWFLAHLVMSLCNHALSVVCRCHRHRCLCTSLPVTGLIIGASYLTNICSYAPSICTWNIKSMWHIFFKWQPFW